VRNSAVQLALGMLWLIGHPVCAAAEADRPVPRSILVLMGLAICRSIIENHDRRILVTTGSERGSVFHFVVPDNR
jgi:hypothetical protein